MTKADCERVLTQFARKELTALHGLPSCTTQEVARVLAPVGSPDRGHLGEPSRELELQRYRVPAYKEPVRGWFASGKLVLLDVEYPEPAEGWQALTRALGEPDGKLDFAWHIHSLENAEWVYGQRGLAVVVKPDPGLILRVAAFAPTTIDRYRTELRLISTSREEP